MDEAALLARAVPRRAVRADHPAFGSVAKSPRGTEHLAKVCQRDFSLLMTQLGEKTEEALAHEPHGVGPVAAAPAQPKASAPAEQQPRPPPAIHRNASPRQVRRNAAAIEARRKVEYSNSDYASVKMGVRVSVDVTTLRAVGSVPELTASTLQLGQPAADAQQPGRRGSDRLGHVAVQEQPGNGRVLRAGFTALV